MSSGLSRRRHDSGRSPTAFSDGKGEVREVKLPNDENQAKTHRAKRRTKTGDNGDGITA